MAPRGAAHVSRITTGRGACGRRKSALVRDERPMLRSLRRARRSALAFFTAATWLTLVGCGGRTELTLSESEGGAGSNSAVGGTGAGAVSFGGAATSAGAGDASVTGRGDSGTSAIGGAVSTGGATSTGGVATVGGRAGMGGAGLSCAPGESPCGNDCVNLATDSLHCGACEKACASETACQGARCVSICATPLSSCGDYCVDLQNDLANCASCGHGCPTVAGADSLCENARCTIVCRGATSNCDGDILNGCETPLAHCRKRVFVSSALYTGDLGGLAGADAKCQALADAAAIGGTYKAWLSDDTVSAADRFTHSTDSYVLLSGREVAADWNALVSFMVQPIDETELRGVPTATPGLHAPCNDAPAVMTGTLGDGSIDQGATCNSWTDGTSFFVDVGNTNYGASLWTAHCASDWCGVPMHIYCFEQ